LLRRALEIGLRGGGDVALFEPVDLTTFGSSVSGHSNDHPDRNCDEQDEVHNRGQGARRGYILFLWPSSPLALRYALHLVRHSSGLADRWNTLLLARGIECTLSDLMSGSPSTVASALIGYSGNSQNGSGKEVENHKSGN
jgi:hypothetical protein